MCIYHVDFYHLFSAFKHKIAFSFLQWPNLISPELDLKHLENAMIILTKKVVLLSSLFHNENSHMVDQQKGVMSSSPTTQRLRSSHLTTFFIVTSLKSTIFKRRFSRCTKFCKLDFFIMISVWSRRISKNFCKISKDYLIESNYFNKNDYLLYLFNK